jgi:hypothetical protein
LTNASTFSRRFSHHDLIFSRRASSASSTALFAQIVQSTKVVPAHSLQAATSEQNERPWRSSASSAFVWFLQSRLPWFAHVGHCTTGSFGSACGAAAVPRAGKARTRKQRRRDRSMPVGSGFMSSKAF